MRAGISLGMTVIDTAEIYGSEEFIGRAIAGQRDRVFLVSKVWPNHVAGDGIARACEASLARLGTDHLDLYLLHWPQKGVGISHIVSAFESLQAKGKIRAWGVSNFGIREMEELFRVPRGDRCATNQIPYSLDDRAIEHGVLPWCRKRGMPIMAYSPLGGEGAKLLRDPALARIGAERTVAPQPPLRWPGLFAAATSLRSPSRARWPTSRRMRSRSRSRSRRKTYRLSMLHSRRAAASADRERLILRSRRRRLRSGARPTRPSRPQRC